MDPSEAQTAPPLGGLTESSEQAGSGFRAGLVGLGLLLLIAYIVPGWVLWLRGNVGAGGYLPLIPFFAVLLFLGLRRLPRPVRLRFSGKEIRIVFGILTLGIAGIQTIGFIIALLPMPYYFATPENDYEGHFLSEVPAYLVPYEDPGDGSLPDAIVRFYRGSAPEQTVPWGVWIGPLAWWFALMALLFGTQVCLGSLLRKQWEDNEKLMFPHVSMVTGLLEPGTQERPSLWHSRWFWTGAALSAFILTLEGLKHYFPSVPAPGLANIDMRPFLLEEPWSSMRRYLKIHPYMVAISYMLTTEISFSIWFFAVVDNFLKAGVTAFGLPRTVASALGGGLNDGSDGVGAVIVFVGAMFWTGRHHLMAAARTAVGKGAPVDDSEEGMSHTWAFWGFWVCAAGVLVWCGFAGLSLWFSALVFGLYTVAVVFVSRMVSETGMIASRVPFRSTNVAIKWVGFGGGDLTERAMGQMATRAPLLRTMSVLSFIYPSVLVSGGVMTNLLTGMRAASGVPDQTTRDRVSRRRILQVGFLGLFLAAAIFAWRMLEETYSRGALHSSLGWFHSGIWVFENTLVRDIILRERAQTTNWMEVSFVGVGAVIMGILLHMRRAFYWWPLHPIGYIATGISGGLWFSVFVGWTIKRTTLKYGGGEGFKRSIPFFVGLFAGQYAMGALWYLIGLAGGEIYPPFSVFRNQPG